MTKREEHTPFYFNEEFDQALRECDEARAREIQANYIPPIRAFDEGCEVAVDGKHGRVRYCYTNGFTLVQFDDEPIMGGIFNNSSTFRNESIAKI